MLMMKCFHQQPSQESPVNRLVPTYWITPITCEVLAATCQLIKHLSTASPLWSEDDSILFFVFEEVGYSTKWPVELPAEQFRMILVILCQDRGRTTPGWPDSQHSCNHFLSTGLPPCATNRVVKERQTQQTGTEGFFTLNFCHSRNFNKLFRYWHFSSNYVKRHFLNCKFMDFNTRRDFGAANVKL